MGHHAQLHRHRASKDTSLAIVAPGIAEALFATALGLAAAIPAVVAYNQIAVALGRAASRANAAATTLARAFARPALAQPGGRVMGVPLQAEAAEDEDSGYRPLADINITCSSTRCSCCSSSSW